LTNGAGRTGTPRLPATIDLLQRLGARPSDPSGRFTDRHIYQNLLDHHADFFLNLAGELAAALVRERIPYVVGDAAEGYNPSHDVCRLLINAAVEIVRRSAGTQIANYDFPLTGIPD